MLKKRKKTALLYKYDSAIFAQANLEDTDKSVEESEEGRVKKPSTSSLGASVMAGEERYSTAQLKEMIETRSNQGPSNLSPLVCSIHEKYEGLRLYIVA